MKWQQKMKKRNGGWRMEASELIDWQISRNTTKFHNFLLWTDDENITPWKSKTGWVFFWGVGRGGRKFITNKIKTIIKSWDYSSLCYKVSTLLTKHLKQTISEECFNEEVGTKKKQDKAGQKHTKECKKYGIDLLTVE